MKRYFDSSVLFKAYIRERESEEAISWITKSNPPLPFTHLHEIEIKTALRSKAQRREINLSELKKALKGLEQDLVSGVLVRPSYELAEVFQRAEEVSARYAGVYACRTLDILHVAAALILKAEHFFSFNARQNTIAQKAGLIIQNRG